MNKKDFNDELNEKWNPKKRYSYKLSSVYSRIGYHEKAKRVSECGNILNIGCYSDGKHYLQSANFCKDPLCPMCAWRKEIKMFNQTVKCVDVLKSDYDFIFMTLTVKNIPADSNLLKDTVKSMNKAFNKFKRLQAIKNIMCGCLKSLEVTYDGNEFITKDMYNGNKKRHIKSKKRYYDKHGLKIGDKNPNYNMLHPHFHLLVAVPKGYCKSDAYIKQSDLCNMWKNSLGVDYVPMCDIRKVTNKKQKIKGKYITHDFSSAVAEVCKYSVKSSDYLNFSDKENEKIVKVLVDGLLGIRMFNFMGVLREMRKRLKLGEIDSDLIHVDDDEKSHGDLLYTMVFLWSPKKKEYIQHDVIMSERILDISTDSPGSDPPLITG